MVELTTLFAGVVTDLVKEIAGRAPLSASVDKLVIFKKSVRLRGRMKAWHQ